MFIKGYWQFSTFFSSYFIIPLVLIFYTFGKLFWKTKLKSPHDVPLKPLFFDVQQRPEPPYPKLKGWQKLTWLWA